MVRCGMGCGKGSQKSVALAAASPKTKGSGRAEKGMEGGRWRSDLGGVVAEDAVHDVAQRAAALPHEALPAVRALVVDLARRGRPVPETVSDGHGRRRGQRRRRKAVEGGR